jgi:hypothetical protein
MFQNMLAALFHDVLVLVSGDMFHEMFVYQSGLRRAPVCFHGMFVY